MSSGSPRSTARQSSFSPISVPDSDAGVSNPLLSPASTKESISSSYVAIEMNDLNEKPTPKLRSKRKDTATSSIANFFHRLTNRSTPDAKASQQAEEREKLMTPSGGGDLVVEEVTETTLTVERPEALSLSGEEEWFEPKTSFEEGDTFFDGYKTALDEQHTSNVVTASRHSSVPDSGRDPTERTMDEIFEDFREGRMLAITQKQKNALEAAVNAQAQISDLHIKIAETPGAYEKSRASEVNKQFDELYDLLNRVHEHVDAVDTLE